MVRPHPPLLEIRVTTYTALTDAVGGNLALSALVGALPLITFFVMLLAVKARAHVSGLTALAMAVLVAVLGFGMPWDLALLSASQGAVFGLFPHRVDRRPRPVVLPGHGALRPLRGHAHHLRHHRRR